MGRKGRVKDKTAFFFFCDGGGVERCSDEVVMMRGSVGGGLRCWAVGVSAGLAAALHLIVTRFLKALGDNRRDSEHPPVTHHFQNSLCNSAVGERERERREGDLEMERDLVCFVWFSTSGILPQYVKTDHIHL